MSEEQVRVVYFAPELNDPDGLRLALLAGGVLPVWASDAAAFVDELGRSALAGALRADSIAEVKALAGSIRFDPPILVLRDQNQNTPDALVENDLLAWRLTIRLPIDRTEVAETLRFLIQSRERTTRLAAKLAHDLRNPLGAMNNASRLLSKTNDPEHIKFAKELIDAQIEVICKRIDAVTQQTRYVHAELEDEGPGVPAPSGPAPPTRSLPRLGCRRQCVVQQRAWQADRNPGARARERARWKIGARAGSCARSRRRPARRFFARLRRVRCCQGSEVGGPDRLHHRRGLRIPNRRPRRVQREAAVRSMPRQARGSRANRSDLERGFQSPDTIIQASKMTMEPINMQTILGSKGQYGRACRILRGLAFAVCVLMSSRMHADGRNASPEDGWVSLFNGKNLEGWTPKIKGYDAGVNYADTFRVEDGVLKVSYDKYPKFDGAFGHLFTAKKYSNYRLRVEYRFVGDQCPGGPGWAIRNSGAMIHCQPVETMRKDQEFPVSVEVQVLGGNGKDKRPTCNMCSPGTHVVIDGKLIKTHCVDSKSPTFHGDQWVTAEVEVRGNGKIKHYVNGELVMEYEKPQLDDSDGDAKNLIKNGNVMLSEGFIALQAESHPIEFRKVEIKELKE